MTSPELRSATGARARRATLRRLRLALQEPDSLDVRELQELVDDAAAVAIELDRERLQVEKRRRAAVVRARQNPLHSRVVARRLEAEDRLAARASELRALIVQLLRAKHLRP